MSPQPSRSFDFDEWSRLAREDPSGFEACRSRAIEDLISQAPGHRQARLRGLQWQIDQVRATSGTPLAACLRISNMMWESVTGSDGLIARMEALRGERRLPRRRQSAKILKFASPRSH
ncbi:DUF3135 domain-containing protein [Ectothiorhodospiraceae bacterium WFHF3C12]|nr:DUF3135 domain-containing protein [Ectothiorhodospiraceae bacterium WFHF3C12]